MTIANHNKNMTETFVDAGSVSLRKYEFASHELQSMNKSMASNELFVSDVADKAGGQDEEKAVQFRMNATGNIFYSTSSPELQGDTKRLFNSVTVLFAAMTKALADNNKTLFDYEAWSSIISKSGYFVEVQKFQKHLVIEKNSLAVNTQIVQQLLPGIASGSSMEIAKNVLNAINGEFGNSQTTEGSKIGHLMFICEELFGAPSVTVRLFFATKSSHESITSSPCHKTTSVRIELMQEANTFLFVSPDTIAEFATQFSEVPQAFEDLVSRLSGYVAGKKAK